MALSQEIKDYIDALCKSLDFIANGTRLPGSETGEHSLISGINNAANAPYSAAIGSNNEVKLDADSAVALGDNSIAYSPYQFVHGKYNHIDANNNYAHIVGGGTGPTAEERKNIYTLDWHGNATFAGNVAIAGDVIPQSDGDLITLDFLRRQLAIQFFPHVLSSDGLVSTIYVNDLEPFTLYKVKPVNQARVMFAVRTEQGRETIFYSSDLSINRLNMFVGDKTNDAIVLFIDSTVYAIDLKTGKLSVSSDNNISVGEGTGGESLAPINSADIVKDHEITANATWSSDKLSNLFDDVDKSLSNTFSRAAIIGNYEFLVFYNEQGEEMGNIPLPLMWRFDEDCVEIWNRSQIKITAGNVGKPGQMLIYERIDQYDEVVGIWTDTPLGIYNVDTFIKLGNIPTTMLSPGALCYVIDTDVYYKFNVHGTWEEFSAKKIHVSAMIDEDEIKSIQDIFDISEK